MRVGTATPWNCPACRLGRLPDTFSRMCLNHNWAPAPSPFLTVDSLKFKDLDRNNKVDPFEDCRPSAEVRAADPAYAELLRVNAVVPTVFVTTLERPSVLQNVVSHSTALLATFGIADEPLLCVVTGQIAPF